MEKLKFRVIASDKLYERLLRLELLRLGLVEADENSKDYHILAAEGLCELPPHRRLKAAIFVDCGLLSAAMPEQVRLLILERPFSLAELRDFVKDVMERADDREYEENSLIISAEDMTVSFGEATVKLTPREFSLLSYLHARPGETISRAELLHNLWMDENARDTNVVDVYVRFLRQKLDEPLGLRLIRAVRGEGYVYAYENSGALARMAIKRADGEEDNEAENQIKI